MTVPQDLGCLPVLLGAASPIVLVTGRSKLARAIASAAGGQSPPRRSRREDHGSVP